MTARDGWLTCDGCRTQLGSRGLRDFLGPASLRSYASRLGWRVARLGWLVTPAGDGRRIPSADPDRLDHCPTCTEGDPDE